MKKASELLGLNVVDNSCREKICKIKDIIYSEKKDKIIGFKITKNLFKKNSKIINFDEILFIGNDFIVINNKEDVKTTNNTITSLVHYESQNILDYEVKYEDGETIGYIKDIIVDENNGKILGYILTDGIFEDLINGRNILPNLKDINYLDDSIIVPKSIKDKFYDNQEIYKKMLE